MCSLTLCISLSLFLSLSVYLCVTLTISFHSLYISLLLSFSDSPALLLYCKRSFSLSLSLSLTLSLSRSWLSSSDSLSHKFVTMNAFLSPSIFLCCCYYSSASLLLFFSVFPIPCTPLSIILCSLLASAVLRANFALQLSPSKAYHVLLRMVVIDCPLS